MRRAVFFFVVAACAAAVACASFGAGPDEIARLDGGSDAPDVTVPDDAGRICFEAGKLSTSQSGGSRLTALADNGLVYTALGDGSAYANTTVPIAPGTTHVLVVFSYSNFTHIGGWGDAAANPFVDLAGVAYADSVDRDPQVRASMGANDAVDLNVFHTSTDVPDSNEAGKTPQPNASTGQITFDVDFASPSGRASMAIGPADALVFEGALGTSTGATPTAITAFIGGSASGQTASTSITFTTICVTPR